METQLALPATSDELLEFLQRPSSYPSRPQSVELVETHISWIFLVGRSAYKLKKPVHFDFLDFSSCERRRLACEAELRLNRRLSPSVYRAVVPVCRRKSRGLTIGGEGEVVDWLVKMRRLDDQRTLHAILAGGSRLGDVAAQVRMVARHLAKFYATQAPLTVLTSRFRQNLRHHIDDNEDQLLQIAATDADAALIRLIHGSQRRFLVTHQDLFDNRVRDGRIVDGHGDLRPEHIYLYSRPLVIDCIEFNSEYRANDIVDELSFLAMECDRLGAPAVGQVLFDTYLAASNDMPAAPLVAFYKSYRACVRAKVASLRSQQQPIPQASHSLGVEHDYLQLAASYLPQFGLRTVMLVGGLMGSGKSTLASQLGRLLSAEIVSSDLIRQQLTQAHKNNGTQLAFGNGKYSVAARRQTYRALIAAAAQALTKSEIVILDATFSDRFTRQLAVELARDYSAKLLQVECQCPREIAISRIADRKHQGRSASEAKPEFYDFQAAEAEPPLTSVPLVHVDTTWALGHQEALVLKQVREQFDKSHHKGMPDDDRQHPLSG